MKLLREQQYQLLQWAAEGLRLKEINRRAAELDPPFTVGWPQLKHARERVGKRFSELREDLEKDAITKGLSRKLEGGGVSLLSRKHLKDGRLRLLIYISPEIGEEVETALIQEDSEEDLPSLINRLLVDWLKWRHV